MSYEVVRSILDPHISHIGGLQLSRLSTMVAIETSGYQLIMELDTLATTSPEIYSSEARLFVLSTESKNSSIRVLTFASFSSSSEG